MKNLHPKKKHTPKKPKSFGFLLLPHFSTLGYSSAIETLQAANMLADQDLYELCTITTDGLPVRASAGVQVAGDYSLQNMPAVDAFVICGASPYQGAMDKTVLNSIKLLAQQQVILGGVCTGSYILAKAGVLNGYRATIHWWDIDKLRDDFPQIIVSSNLFEFDRDRFTCSGGTAAMDMMLSLVGKQHGVELAASVSEHFVCERIRISTERQRIPLRNRLGGSQPKLLEAVALMEANIEEPLSTDDLAHHVGVSRRQLERLFKKHLDIVPSRYYLELRLEKARQLLRQTSKAIVQVGLSCGFSSGPHFSTAYRNHFNMTPREERNLKMKQQGHQLEDLS